MTPHSNLPADGFGDRTPPRRLAVALVVSSVALLLAGFRAGPLPGMTGGFGEPTCRKCHFDQALDDGAGTLRVTGVPESYTPGRRYVISVELSRPALKRGGFELSARFAAGRQAGRQGGRLAAADERVQIVTSPDGAVQYAQHTRAGSAASMPGRLGWTVGWTAPAVRGPVIFHAAANAADDDDSPLGDFIYTTAVTSGGARRIRPSARRRCAPGSPGETCRAARATPAPR